MCHITATSLTRMNRGAPPAQALSSSGIVGHPTKLLLLRPANHFPTGPALPQTRNSLVVGQSSIAVHAAARLASWTNRRQGLGCSHGIKATTSEHYASANELPDVCIHVGGTTFAASSALLRMFSTCARGMPEPFTTWDLDTLPVFKGTPPAPGVVAAWLEALYWFEDTCHAPNTLLEAVPVLQFANAVGSPAGLMNAIVDRITSNWALHIGPDIVLPISPAGPLYVALPSVNASFGRTEDICSVPPGTATTDRCSLLELFSGAGYGCHIETPPQKLIHIHVDRITRSDSKLVKEAASQLEELLFLAHNLKLDRLAQALHSFIRQQLAVGENGFFYGSEELILSRRVLQSLRFKPAAEGWLRWITGNGVDSGRQLWYP